MKTTPGALVLYALTLIPIGIVVVIIGSAILDLFLAHARGMDNVRRGGRWRDGFGDELARQNRFHGEGMFDGRIVPGNHPDVEPHPGAIDFTKPEYEDD